MEGAIKILKALYARSSNTSPSRCRHWSGVPVNAVRSYDATQRDSALDMYFKDKQEVNEELSKQADDQLHYQQQVSDMDVQSICGLSFVLPPTLWHVSALICTFLGKHMECVRCGVGQGNTFRTASELSIVACLKC